jgi:SRSO17 transposase
MQGEQEERFVEYIERLKPAVGATSRHEGLVAYCCGLALPGERKSVEPMAARIDPTRVSSRHQSMHHFVADADWSDAAVLRVAREYALERIVGHGPIESWIIDDTGIPKKGKHSVGVAHQYCGALGKTANSQNAVSLSLVNATASIPAGYRMFLPKQWVDDAARRKKAGVPEDIGFKTKWEIALDLIDEVIADGLCPPHVGADAGYGDVTAFRDALTARMIPYTVAVSKTTSVWKPGQQPLPPAPRTDRWGRPATNVRRTPEHQPVNVKDLACSLDASAWHDVTWREGTKGPMQSRFAAVRVRPAHRDYNRREPRAEEWLLIEWPKDEAEPMDYWLSTEAADVPLASLVHRAKLRWRIERDFEELKDELGLDHYEGRNWRGFHHHATLCIAVYGFLIAERARLSPPRPGPIYPVAAPPVPEDFRPRGASATR